uniref:Uncharacterized protein n=1 Tax=Glossina pallidipes TaxID=7398 RepID=A0A1A9ZUQ1_GLOPL
MFWKSSTLNERRRRRRSNLHWGVILLGITTNRFVCVHTISEETIFGLCNYTLLVKSNTALSRSNGSSISRDSSSGSSIKLSHQQSKSMIFGVSIEFEHLLYIFAIYGVYYLCTVFEHKK